MWPTTVMDAATSAAADGATGVSGLVLPALFLAALLAAALAAASAQWGPGGSSKLPPTPLPPLSSYFPGGVMF